MLDAHAPAVERVEPIGDVARGDNPLGPFDAAAVIAGHAGRDVQPGRLEPADRGRRSDRDENEVRIDRAAVLEEHALDAALSLDALDADAADHLNAAFAMQARHALAKGVA